MAEMVFEIITIDACKIVKFESNRITCLKFCSLIHPFTTGVADQLQTNYASDLRNILKNVFEITANPHKPFDEDSEMNQQTDAIASPGIQSPSTEGQSEVSSTDQNLDGANGVDVSQFANEIMVVMDSMADQDNNANIDASQIDTQPSNGTKLLKLAPLEKGESLEMEATLSDDEWQAQQRILDENRDTDDEVFTLNLEDESSRPNSNQTVVEQNKTVDSQRANNSDSVEQSQQQQEMTATADEDLLKKENVPTCSSGEQLVQDELSSGKEKASLADHQLGGAEQEETTTSVDEVKENDDDNLLQHVVKEDPDQEGKEQDISGDGEDKRIDVITPTQGDIVDSLSGITTDHIADDCKSSTPSEVSNQKNFETTISDADQKTLNISDQKSTTQEVTEQKSTTQQVTEQKSPTSEEISGQVSPITTEAVQDQRSPDAPEVADQDVASSEEVSDQKSLSAEEGTDKMLSESGDDSATTPVVEPKPVEGDNSSGTAIMDQKTLDGNNMVAGACGGSSKSLAFVMDQRATEGGEDMPAVRPKKKRHKSGDLSRRPGQFEGEINMQPI